MAQAYYPGCATTPVPFYTCDPCGGIELGKIRSTAFIHRSYYDTLMIDPTDPELWRTGIEEELIYIIPKVIGALDAPDPDTIEGFGDDEESNLGRVFTLTWRDPNYADNCNFYNAINGKNGVYHMAWRTQTKTHISVLPVTPDVKAPVEEGQTSAVTWQGRARWRSMINSCPFDTPVDIFDCFALV